MIIAGCIIALVLFLLGSPIFAALGIGSWLLAVGAFDFSYAGLGSLYTSSLNSFTLIALPLFVLMGDLFLASGAKRPLVDFMNLVFGRIHGSMGVAAVAGCAFFAAISGSSTATAVTIGLIMLPEMSKLHYKRGFSASIIAVSGGIGNLIPPSIFFILYGTLYEVDIAALYAAGMLPGLFCSAMLALTVFGLSKWHYKHPLPPLEPRPLKEKLNIVLKATPALAIPVMVLGGIYTGVFTPTEAAAVACGIIIIIGFLVYRTMTLKDVWVALLHSARTVGSIMVMVASGVLLGKMFVLGGLPDAVTNFVMEQEMNKNLFLLLSGLVMACLGTFVECVLMIYVCASLFFQAAITLGVSPIHFGVIIVVASLLGMTTPPMAESIFVVSKISGTPSAEIVKAILPFIVTWLLNFLIVLFWPELSLILPRLLGFTV